MAEAVARRAALAVIAHFDLQLVRPVADGHIRMAGARVLERVGQAFLNYSIGREVDRPWELEGLAVDVQPHRKAGAADLFQERVEAAETRLGCQFEVFAVAAHRPEEAAHLGERCAAGLLDASERIRVLGECFGELVPDGADLEHHHADSVGDDVVELARDPRALLGDGDAGR